MQCLGKLRRGNGNLLELKQDASFAIAQEDRLRKEGVESLDGLISGSDFVDMDGS